MPHGAFQRHVEASARGTTGDLKRDGNYRGHRATSALFAKSPGNLQWAASAWWARQDSNLQPSGYEASHCSPCTLAQIGSAAGRSPEAAETAGSMVSVIFSARRLTPCHAVHRAVVADFLVTQIDDASLLQKTLTG